MAELSVFENDGELFVDSRLIAERLGIEHESFLKTLETYQTQIEQAFGVFRFEIGKPTSPQGGRPSRFVFLNEDQATFVMTLSRNSPEVVQAKIDLVVAFASAKARLKEIQEKERVQRQVPYWYQRIKIALSDTVNPIQSGYFCVYLEMMNFFQELEIKLGYVLPDLNPETEEHLVPDISIGRKFNAWLRSDQPSANAKRLELLGSEEIIDFRSGRWNKDKVTKKPIWVDPGSHHHEVRVYNHVYPETSHGEYGVQEASSYPNKYIPIFLYYLENIWIPESFKPYLSDRSPEGWAIIEQQLMTLTPIEKSALRGTLLGKLFPLLPPG